MTNRSSYKTPNSIKPFFDPDLGVMNVRLNLKGLNKTKMITITTMMSLTSRSSKKLKTLNQLNLKKKS